MQMGVLFTISMAKWLRRPLVECEVEGSIQGSAVIFSDEAGWLAPSQFNKWLPIAGLPGAWHKDSVWGGMVISTNL